jgi:uncharacterized protein (DUF4415 family)
LDESAGHAPADKQLANQIGKANTALFFTIFDLHRAPEGPSPHFTAKGVTTAKLPKKTSAKVNDPVNPVWTEDMLGAPVLKRGRGPQAAPTKVLTSVRLDADILEFFKAQGAGYQSRMNAALRKAMEQNLTGRPSTITRKRAVA